MKAQDLRLENYLEQGKIIELRKNVCRIEYKSDRIRTALISYTDLKPIPLTEEILLKCGFSRRGITSNNGSKLTLHHIDNMYPKGRVYWNSWCILEYIPKYLHQLQNLYWCLCGEELNVNI